MRRRWSMRFVEMSEQRSCRLHARFDHRSPRDPVLVDEHCRDLHERVLDDLLDALFHAVAVRDHVITRPGEVSDAARLHFGHEGGGTIDRSAGLWKCEARWSPP